MVKDDKDGTSEKDIIDDNYFHNLTKDKLSGNINYIILWSARHNDSAVLEKALDNRLGDVNIQDSDGFTALHYVMFRYHSATVSIVEKLLNNGAKVNIQDEDGYTPLHIAAACRARQRYVELLLAKGAAVDLKNNKKQTPYDVAHKTSITKYLLGVHVIKLKIAGIIKNFKPRLRHEKIEIACTRELEKIKLTKINKSTSLYILISHRGHPYYLSNKKTLKNLERVLDSPDFSLRFPEYSSILRMIFLESKQRCFLLELAAQSFRHHKRKTYLQSLPRLAVDEVLQYLSNEDLKKLIESVPQ